MSDFVLRELRPGDGEWIVYRHGVLYAAEYGWDARFEELVSGVMSRFLERRDPVRERAWVAERDGRIVGSVMVRRHTDTEARLHLLLVEPEARGSGLGSHLVEECIRFARAAGYERISLWTNEVLADARRLYQKAGFRLLHSEPHDHFGQGMVGETWALDL